MRYAIIDLGTNTFNLLIAEVKGIQSRKIFGTKEVVKLGQGGITRNIIPEKPFLRGIQALVKYKKILKKHRVVKVFAFGTSAIRDAKNRKQFVQAAFRKTGIKINIINGDKEAELIYLGVNQALVLGKKKSLIMDIGGGSTEFIIANEKKIFWKKSFQLGVSRLLEIFEPGDPIKKSEIEKIKNYFDKILIPLFKALRRFPARALVGSSGSFDSFADIIAGKFYSKKILRGKSTYDFILADLKIIHKEILASTFRQRLKMKGLVAFRAENIVLASILTQFIIYRSGIKKIKLSKFALKEGVLWSILNRGKVSTE